MNRKQLTTILVAFVVLGGLGLWLRQRDVASYRTSSGAMGQKVLGEFDVNAVTRFVLRQGTNTLTLAQKEERWVVAERGDYPANFSEVGETLRKLWDLKIVQPVPGPLGANALERLELNPEAAAQPATLIELQDQSGKPLKSLLLGKQHRRRPATPSPMGGEEGWPDGRYVMVPGQTSSASLVSETFSNLEPKPESWLNRDFFKVEKTVALAVTYPEPTNSWRMTRPTETGEWTLADLQPGELLDASKTTGFNQVLSWPSFEDVLVNPDPALLGLDQPLLAELTSADGFQYALKIGQREGEEKYYLTLTVQGTFPKERTPGAEESAEDKERLDKEFKEKTDKLVEKLKKEKALEGWVFQVSKWTLDSLLKKRAELLKDATKADDAAGAAGAAPGPLPGFNPVDATIPPVPPGLPALDLDEEDNEE